MGNAFPPQLLAARRCAAVAGIAALALAMVLLAPSPGRATRTTVGQGLMHALESGAPTVDVFVAGDSTGDEEDEWVYRLGIALEVRFPDYSVKYWFWDRKRRAWPADPAVLQWGASGSGSPTLNIWNMSVSGARESYARQFAVREIAARRPDIVFVSYGQNDGTDVARFRWGLESLVTALGMAAPQSEVVLIAQNPAVGNTYQDARAAETSAVADSQGVGLVDVYSAFAATGNAAAYLREDGVHPNGAGTSLWLATVLSQLGNGSAPHQIPPAARGAPVIRNGDFSVFAKGRPTGWTTTNVTVAKDFAHGDDAQRFALRLTQNGNAPGSFSYPLNANWLRGKWVTVAARMFVPDQPDDVSVGQLGLVDDKTTQASSVQLPAGVHGSYYWEIVSRIVDPRATKASIVLYVNQQPARSTLIVQRVVAVIGKRAPLDDAETATPPRSLGD